MFPNPSPLNTKLEGTLFFLLDFEKKWPITFFEAEYFVNLTLFRKNTLSGVFILHLHCVTCVREHEKYDPIKSQQRFSTILIREKCKGSYPSVLASSLMPSCLSCISFLTWWWLQLHKQTCTATSKHPSLKVIVYRQLHAC